MGGFSSLPIGKDVLRFVCSGLRTGTDLEGSASGTGWKCELEGRERIRSRFVPG